MNGKTLTVIHGLCEVCVMCIYQGVKLSLTPGKYCRLCFLYQPLWQITYSPWGIFLLLQNRFGWWNTNLAVVLQLSELSVEQTLPVMRALTSTGITSTVKTDALTVLWVLWIKCTKLYFCVIIKMTDNVWTPAVITDSLIKQNSPLCGPHWWNPPRSPPQSGLQPAFWEKTQMQLTAGRIS